MNTIELTLHGLTLEIDYDYFEGEPMTHTFDSGDPGVPGTASSIDIKEIRLMDDEGDFHTVDILEFLVVTGQYVVLESKVIEMHED